MIDKRKLRPIFMKVIKEYIKTQKKPTVSDIVARLATLTLQNKDKITYTTVDFAELVYFIELVEKELYGKKK